MAQIIYEDIDIFGREINGNLTVHQQDKALSNAMVNWFTSKAGDYIYDPQLGGILDRQLFKLMTQQQSNDLKEFFLDQLTQNFGGIADILSINVDQDKTLRILNIEITYRSLLTNNINLVQFNTSQKFKSPVKDLLDVQYVGENLTNFVLVKLPDLPATPFVYDETSGKWTWGPYKLVNLSSTDSNFQSLYNLVRGY